MFYFSIFIFLEDEIPTQIPVVTHKSHKSSCGYFVSTRQWSGLNILEKCTFDIKLCSNCYLSKVSDMNNGFSNTKSDGYDCCLGG